MRYEVHDWGGLNAVSGGAGRIAEALQNTINGHAVNGRRLVQMLPLGSGDLLLVYEAPES